MFTFTVGYSLDAGLVIDLMGQLLGLLLALGSLGWGAALAAAMVLFSDRQRGAR